MKIFKYIFLFCIFSSLVDAGEIVGDVRFEGKKVKFAKPAPVGYQGRCGQKYPASVIRMWKDRVTNVTLWLVSKNTIKQEPEIVNMVGWKCEFRPMILPIIPGSTVRLANEDNESQWIVITEPGQKKKQLTLGSGEKPHELKIGANNQTHLMSGFYPWMQAWIRPVHNLVATTTTIEDGRFFFKDVPIGEYTLHAWHPSIGETSIDLNIKNDKKMKVQVVFNRPIEELEAPIIQASPLEKNIGGDKDLDENPFKRK